MLYLSGLPFEALQEVFLHIGQPHALALAPLHSKFYCITRIKLYRRIYVYEGSVLKGTRRHRRRRFQFHKDINNIRSSAYTIVARHNFSKYLSKMHTDIEVSHLLVREFNELLMQRILKHFKVLRQVELVSDYLKNGSCVGLDAILFMLMDYKKFQICPNPIEFIPSTLMCYDPGFFPSSTRTISIDDGWFRDHINNFSSLTSLTIIISNPRALVDLHLRTLNKLHRLHLHHVSPKSIDYCVSEMYDTSLLLELSVVGEFQLQTVFKNRELDKDYPRLSQLCIRNYEETEDTIKDLKDFRHNNISILIVTSRYSNHRLAQMVSELRFNFPKSSINWWYEPIWSGMHGSYHETSFTRDINWLSPSLPFCIVGYHFPGKYQARITKTKDATAGPYFTLLKKVYSNMELDAIYKGLLKKDNKLSLGVRIR